MAAPALGITLPAGITVPAGCYIEALSVEWECGFSEVKNGLTNTTVEIVPHRTATGKASMSGYGTPNLATFAAAGNFTPGTWKGVEIGITETNDDVPKFDASFEAHKEA